MRKVFGGALVAMFLTFVGTGNAIEFKEFTDIQYPDTDFLLDKYHNTYSFTHDITDNGFKSTAYTITSADISLAFYDNVDHVGRFPDIFDLIKEHVSFSFDGVSQGQKEIDTETIHFLVDAQLLQNDGTLQVTLKNLKGDVYFDQSTLKAYATENAPAAPTPTPEPGSLLLLGSGLVGLAIKGRKRLGITRRETL